MQSGGRGEGGGGTSPVLLNPSAQVTICLERHLQEGGSIINKNALQRNNQRVAAQLDQPLSLPNGLHVTLETLYSPNASRCLQLRQLYQLQ